MVECSNVMNQILKSEMCVGTWRPQADNPCGANDAKLANQYVVETLEISGAPINAFVVGNSGTEWDNTALLIG